MIRYLRQEEKIRTRAMYEENFPEDSPGFVDYYYTSKIKDNRILVMEEETLQVMIHLNPYEFRICGEQARVNYVVAVATDPAFRKQGKMAEVLSRALKDMAKAHQPFTFLIPANPKVYVSSGFVFVPCEAYAKYQAQPQADIQAAELKEDRNWRKSGQYHGIRLREATRSDIPQMVSFANGLLDQEYDIYPYHTKEYYERAMVELASQNGALVLMEREGQVVGIFSYGRDENLTELQEILVSPGYGTEFTRLAGKWLAAQGTDDRKAGIKQPEITSMDFMIRITDLKAMGQMLRSEEAFSIRVNVKDDILPSNQGCFEIRADQDGSRISMISQAEAECSMEIGELTEFLFGKMKLFIREWV